MSTRRRECAHRAKLRLCLAMDEAMRRDVALFLALSRAPRKRSAPDASTSDEGGAQVFDRIPLHLLEHLFGYIAPRPRLRVLSFVSTRWRLAVRRTVVALRGPLSSPAWSTFPCATTLAAHASSPVQMPICLPPRLSALSLDTSRGVHEDVIRVLASHTGITALHISGSAVFLQKLPASLINSLTSLTFTPFVAGYKSLLTGLSSLTSLAIPTSSSFYIATLQNNELLLRIGSNLVSLRMELSTQAPQVMLLPRLTELHVTGELPHATSLALLCPRLQHLTLVTQASPSLLELTQLRPLSRLTSVYLSVDFPGDSAAPWRPLLALTTITALSASSRLISEVLDPPVLALKSLTSLTVSARNDPGLLSLLRLLPGVCPRLCDIDLVMTSLDDLGLSDLTRLLRTQDREGLHLRYHITSNAVEQSPSYEALPSSLKWLSVRLTWRAKYNRPCGPL